MYVLFYLQDSRLVVDRFKTGFVMPNDIPFEDLSNEGNGMANPPGKAVGRADTSAGTVGRMGTVGASRSKKRTGLRGIFGGQKVYFTHSDPCKQIFSTFKKHFSRISRITCA